ncbi:hypothetical protein HanRHA438_Chr14g0642861 [Helianthus annuus]|nr:hypothetical protein HanRHA438_Chr14g0642861 [Helianthus annuus]
MKYYIIIIKKLWNYHFFNKPITMLINKALDYFYDFCFILLMLINWFLDFVCFKSGCVIWNQF